MPPEVKRDPPNRIPTGMTVFDSDGQFTRLVVVNHPDECCGEFEVPGTGKTVADYNQDYDSTGSVVQTVYRFKLDQEVDDWMSLPLDEIHSAAQEAGLKTYSYPARRMKSSFSHIPERVETYRELFCYQSARMAHLSATVNHPDRLQDLMMWSNYEKRVDGDVTMSSILKENQYQLKENLGVCTYCNRDTKTTFDHIVPVAADGANDIGNMVPVCQSCNSSKSDQNVLDWHQQHGIPVDRVVLGKYLKLRWEAIEADGGLDDTVPETVRERWEGIEIARRIKQKISMNSERQS